MGAIIEGSDVHTFCDDCGKDLTVVNLYGMCCEDLHGLEESKQAFQQVNEMVDGIVSRL